MKLPRRHHNPAPRDITHLRTYHAPNPTPWDEPTCDYCGRLQTACDCGDGYSRLDYADADAYARYFGAW